MDLELRGKNVLITGASKGIGLACARGFAAEGILDQSFSASRVASRVNGGMPASRKIAPA